MIFVLEFPHIKSGAVMDNKKKTTIEDKNKNEENSQKEISQFKKKLILSNITIVILVLFSSWFYVYGDKLYFDDTRFLMNTAYTIKVYGIQGYFGMQAAFKKIKEIEKQTSFYEKESCLYKLNKTGKYTFNTNNKYNMDLLKTIALGSKYMYENTDGYFDPSFASLHEIYGFHTPEKTGKLPDDSLLKYTLLKCGYTHVLHFKENEMTLNEGAMIDFGGIVGGYSILTAREILRAANCKAFLIDDAGDIWFEGEKPDKSPWRVAVKDPRGGSSLAMIVSKTPLAISTSGDYERYVVIDGKKYGHIMNPKTGRPADYYDSVTVVTLDPLQSDVLSTALFAMPPEKAYKWAEDKQIAALFLSKDGNITLSSKGKLYFSDLKVK